MVNRLVRMAGVLAVLTLGTAPALGADMVVSREVEISGDDVAGLLAGPVADMEWELAGQGCHAFARAYWSETTPLRALRVEVRCKEGEDHERISLR